ncbi:MAG: glycoside hydrolase family 5 protein [Ruminiclostridium sp.]|nr:glycoside hydrolase family 5 protein [Ruminiclostridium sp.]
MKTSFFRKSAACLAAAIMTISACTAPQAPAEATPSETQVSEQTAPEEKNELTALEVTKLMGNGINLGNTMEAYNHQGYLNGQDPCSFESLWGMPHTTQEMIDGMKASGFDTLRVPVAWTNGMNYESGDYTIDERLFARVEEIVNYALNADMYVIVNDHWDGGWWGMFGSASQETRNTAMEMYKAMWQQIADRFRDYSYKLVLESANEDLGDGLNNKDNYADSGALKPDEIFDKIYEINSEFVKTVRATGGKNEDRFLLIAGYNTDFDHTSDDRYRMPEDSAQNKLIVSVHYYGPWDYCGTKAVNQWGSPIQYKEQNETLAKMTKFTEQGYGVIIGEYGVLTDGKPTPKPDTDIYFTNFLNNCDLYNYCPLLWDCNGLYRRRDGKIYDETIAKLFLDRSYSAQSSLTDEQIADNARKGMAEALEAAEARMSDEGDIPATDDTAVAWIMYQSGDYAVSYSVGDIYDPTNKTVNVKATNALITGDGEYTVSLDLSGAGGGKGVTFSALGIYNGEILYPDHVITIKSFKVNGEEKTLDGKGYTCTDDGKCTRMNLYNGWVSAVPDDPRMGDGTAEEASAQIWKAGAKETINTIEITFTFAAV